MSRKVEFLTSSDSIIVVDLTPDLAQRLMELLAGATAGWLLLGAEPNMWALQVSRIVTWKIMGGAE